MPSTEALTHNDVDQPNPRLDRAPRILALLALASFAGAAVLVIGLDLQSGRFDARQTVSAYVFTHPVAFTSAVLLLVAGSVVLGMALARSGRLGRTGGVLLGVWALGLTTVAIFPKHDWSVGPSMSGHIHRVASLVAFIALPLAVSVLTARSWRRGGAITARLGAVCGFAAAAVLAYLVWSVVESQFTGVPWWQAVDLGLVERVLIGFEVAALVALAIGTFGRPADKAPRPALS